MITSACPHLHADYGFGVAAAFSSLPTRSLLTTVLAKHGHQLDDLKHTDRGMLAAYQPNELEFISKAVKNYLMIKKAATIFMPARLCQKAFSSFPTRSPLVHVVAVFLDSPYFSHIKWSLRLRPKYSSGNFSG